jgi:hypothetical protein
MFLHLGPCSSYLQSPLDLSPCYASLRHRWKSRSFALSDLDCPLIHQQKIWLRAPTACATDQRLLLPLEKLNCLVWHSGLSSFPNLEPSYPVGGRHFRNSCLLCNRLRGQNPQQVLTIPGGSTLMVESMDRTTPPKVDKVDTSSAEASTAQALVAQSRSKALDDAHVDDDLDLLNVVAAVS